MFAVAGNLWSEMRPSETNPASLTCLCRVPVLLDSIRGEVLRLLFSLGSMAAGFGRLKRCEKGDKVTHFSACQALCDIGRHTAESGGSIINLIHANCHDLSPGRDQPNKLVGFLANDTRMNLPLLSTITVVSNPLAIFAFGSTIDSSR